MLEAVRRAYVKYREYGSRSTEKTKVLHGWVIQELMELLGDGYSVVGQTPQGGKEVRVHGKYYPKKVDVAIFRNDTILGVVSIKFVNSNYRQNKYNYFEQQLGETSNLRRNNIVFGHIFLLTQPIPHRKRSGEIKKFEKVDSSVVNLYASLANDHGQSHVPDVQCLGVFRLDESAEKILRFCTKSDLPNVSSQMFEQLRSRLGINRFFERMVKEVEAKHLQASDSEID